jgi:hypothetical protein
MQMEYLSHRRNASSEENYQQRAVGGKKSNHLSTLPFWSAGLCFGADQHSPDANAPVMIDPDAMEYDLRSELRTVIVERDAARRDMVAFQRKDFWGPFDEPWEMLCKLSVERNSVKVVEWLTRSPAITSSADSFGSAGSNPVLDE